MFITVHFKEKYFQLGNEFQSKMDTFVAKQHEHTSEKTNELRYQLQNELQKLKESHNVDIQNIDKITSLIFTHGINLQDGVTAEQGVFSMDPFIFKFISCHLFTLNNSQLFRHHVTELYKALVICDGYRLRCQYSNPYTRNIISHGFVYVINELKYMKYHLSTHSVNIQLCRMLIDLILFTIQCVIHTFDKNYWSVLNFISLLQSICFSELIIHNNCVVEIITKEIFKLLFDEYAKKIGVIESYWKDQFFKLIKKLIEQKRIDEILFFYQYNQQIKSFFDTPDHTQKLIRLLLGSRVGRQLFDRFLKKKLLESWLIYKEWIFYLVKKREIGFLKIIFDIYPSLVHILDKDGNDLLLYTCLKVVGPRYSLMRILIQAGCNQQRENGLGQTLMDALQLEPNRDVLEFLKNEGVIKVNNLNLNK
ncbi:unnamed protein product [Adineta steineri]|uniref:Uncharacterized protein n=1 Tax=Adineta steineri TaxID=433720 RepID=A0A813WFV2_9BILA|nr:unnamed protein product [Adineta steineri]